LNLIQSIEIVERALCLDEFDEPAGVLFHQIFLQLNEVRRAEPLVAVFLRLYHALQCAERRACELFCNSGQVRGHGAKRDRKKRRQNTKSVEKLPGSRQIDADSSDSRIIDNQRMKIVQVFSKQKRRQSVPGEQAFVRPVAHQGGERIE